MSAAAWASSSQSTCCLNSGLSAVWSQEGSQSSRLGLRMRMSNSSRARATFACQWSIAPARKMVYRFPASYLPGALISVAAVFFATPNPLLRRRINRLAGRPSLICLLFNGSAIVVERDAAPGALDVHAEGDRPVADARGAHVELAVEAEGAEQRADEDHVRILARPRTQGARRAPSGRRCRGSKSRASAWGSAVT